MQLQIPETDPVKPETLPVLLARQVEANHTDLVNRYQQALRQTLFTNRSDVHPKMVRQIAVEEAEALLNSLRRPTPSSSLERGRALCEVGLSEQSLLRLGQTTRQFFLTHLEHELVAPTLELIDAYQSGLIQGFIKSRETIILGEQEQIRSALQIAISRYTIEIKEIEALAREATEANEFKSQFIARIGHELRTPLGALMGISEMLQQEVYGPLTPAQQDIVQRIINNAGILGQVFTELLDQSQIEAGQLRLNEERFSPQTLAQRIHSTCLPLALQKKLTLNLDVDPTLPRTALGDRRRIEQILSNLVLNAIKFTETGSVMIQVHSNSDSHWLLQVKDTGIGIAEENQAYIFEPFRQVDESISRQYGGVGLGLTIVKQLVQLMNGTVGLESKVGQGSTFTVVLPLHRVV